MADEVKPANILWTVAPLLALGLDWVGQQAHLLVAPLAPPIT